MPTLLAVFAALTCAVPGQPQPEVPIFHVYVDPIFGDDAQAFASNPGPNPPTTPPAPFSIHPDAAQFPADVPQGRIRHAPYSFRTLTGPNGVRAYLEQFDLVELPGWVIIHCLPGLYGPTLSAPLDARSGLVYNGEAWPFLLRWNWSLQGTSALDTIFDAREQPTAVVLVAADNPLQLSHRESIIDSLTIRAARVNGDAMSPSNSSGAGIYIAGTPINSPGSRGVQIGVTISNCFIVDNHVGVAIDNPFPIDAHWISDPRIVNCTFARNWIGLWNGDRDPAALENLGWARPVLLNTLFDSWRPDVLQSGTTPFVGIHPYSIAVGAVRMVQGGGGWVNVDPILSYCAWELGRDNFAATLPGWPAPTVPGTIAFPTPRVDLAPYVGNNPTTPRGTLYINDIFRNANIQAVPGLDYTPHDYRLAPSVGTDPSSPLPLLNPLVNRGIRLGYTNGLGETIDGIRMAWTRFGTPSNPPADIELPPGPPDREPDATLHAWDWDCDGFGNPRTVDRSYFPVSTGRFDTDIDIGADEVDELIIAGYIDSTRVLGTGNTVLIGDHRQLYFVNVADTSASWQRPVFNVIAGKTYPWWAHVQGAPDGAMGTNYTAGVPNSRRAQLRLDFSKPLFMRNLECDFSPHLMADPHPLWPIGFQPLSGEVGDIYACNPWWWHHAPVGPAFRHDNGAVYDNVNVAWSPHGVNNVIRQPFGLMFTTVVSGTINPPGAGFTQTGSGALYLHPAYSFGLFVSIPPCQGGGAQTYTTDTWGLGDAGVNCPDLVPTLPDERGLRANFQLFDAAGWHNLQTVLTAKGPPIPVEESMLRGPTPETARRHSRMVENLVRRR